jgi:hypothetical protein
MKESVPIRRMYYITASSLKSRSRGDDWYEKCECDLHSKLMKENFGAKVIIGDF